MRTLQIGIVLLAVGLVFWTLFFQGGMEIPSPRPQHIKVAPAESQSTTTIRTKDPLGQLFMIGHWADTPLASTTALIRDLHIGGVIIMSAPEDPNEIRTWTEAWQNASEVPLMIAIDQEGGPVKRLKGNTFIQTGQRAITTTDQARSVAEIRGAELASLGITMNLAPVLDRAVEPTSFMYDRVFPETSSSTALATAMIEGYATVGIVAVPKHFPGHDDTADDSHTMLPTVPIERDALDEFTRPFGDLFRTHSPLALMTAHVSFPQIDDVPATLSPFFLTEYLRETIDFTGVVITDDLSMDAIDTTYGAEKSAVTALSAGADVILFAAEPERVRGAIAEVEAAVSDGRLDPALIATHLSRIEAFHSASAQ